MLKISTNVSGLKELQKELNRVQTMLSIKNNPKYLKFLQNKVIETLNSVISERLTFSGETVEKYKTNNFIEEIENGFILYNNTTVETQSEGYGGIFSIALAFEYGTGIVGMENPKENAWQYNVKNHETGWTYFKNDRFWYTKGYEGFEIYRYTKEKVNQNITNWIEEFLRKVV